MLEYIYICRHGFRANWIDPSIRTSPTGMNRDPPLAVYGHEQSEHLSTFLSDPNQTAPYPTPELVFSSPFYRCIETSLPTAKKLGLVREAKDLQGGSGTSSGVRLEHGVQEWYSPVVPDTGLHPRPSSPSTLSKHFPSGSINTDYASTVFPSRKGESFKALHERAELFVEAWISKIEDIHPEVKSVVIFAHAASIIVLGRALTGDRDLDVVAGCASTSLYKRKVPSSSSSLAYPRPTESFEATLQPHRQAFDSRPPSSLGYASFTGFGGLAPPSPAFGSLAGTETPPAFGAISREPSPPPPSAALTEEERLPPCGVGEWDIVWNGKADYLPNGLERNWSFADAVIKDDGEVISDKGDGGSYTEEDLKPEGLVEGGEKWLRRGRPPFVKKEKVGLGISSARM
ncbi:uncharacterized protein I303_101410 [Kwoniella dejecticola CBS 10117]|uniref:Transcription factor C subunit 7 n=1 Tax=Kwoniella dejecticola CBS 10117 TaxID=1296121 RepID=A0A1A6AHN8_9TREE|nr:uncharacterized protein I303_01419 [Kwoniella dejecticola CBS 10117]OBR89590.1 hypothetical protein I303_01419 [Kwoniella dejecticola CBS 10117]